MIKRVPATDRQVPTGSTANAGPPDKAATLEAGDGATAIPTQSVTPVERAVISLATVINPHTENNHCQKNPEFSFGYLNLRFNKDQTF